MGISTDGQICYGIKFDDDAEFPWDSEEHEHDIDAWWMDVNGYKPPFEMFDEHGQWIGGKEWEKEKTDEYFDHRRAFLESHPLSVELVNYCSGEYPEYILAIPESCLTASRGYPTEIKLDFATNDRMEWKTRLTEFCKKYGIETPDTPKWWLSSYYSQ